MKKVRIIAHGYLKRLVPDSLAISGYSVADIIRGVSASSPALQPLPGGARYCVRVPGFRTQTELYAALPEDLEELHIYPDFLGGFGTRGGFVKIVIGAVLIAASFYINPALGASLISGGVKALVFNAGVALALGGALELLSPAPQMDLSGNINNDPTASQYFGGDQNTVKIGTRIPLVYGRHKVYGHYLSFNITSSLVG